jgi:hypothetical protein
VARPVKKNRLIKYCAGLWAQAHRAFERHEVMRTLVLALVSLGIAYLTALGIHAQLPNIGDVWHWAAGLWVVLLFIFIAPFRLWSDAQDKLEVYEETAKPKLEISDPIESVEPKGTVGKAFRTWRLKITNISTVMVKGCYAKKKSFINKNGHQSDIIGIRFKMSTDHPKNLQTYIYIQPIL